MSFKNQLIKNYLKIQVIGQGEGVLALRIANLVKLDEEYYPLEAEVKPLVMLLPGIEDIETDFDTGNIEISYDPTRLTGRQVAGWVRVVIDLAVDNLDYIKNNWEEYPEQVKETLSQKLKQKIR